MADKKDLKVADNDKDGLAGGLDDDAAWGDVEDPMAELDAMTDEQV